MDNAIEQLLNLGTLIFAVSIVIVTFFVRRITETEWPGLRKQADENAPSISYSTTFARWYQQVILYAIPVVVGSVLGLVKVPYFFPDSVQTREGRVFFGAVVGWFSSALYKIAKRSLASRGIDLPGNSLVPPAPATPSPPAPPAPPPGPSSNG